MTKIYRMGTVEVTALQKVNFSLNKGDFLSIMGPSGSGKSTLLHLLGCLDRPTAGRLLIGGVEIADQNDRQLACLRNEQIGFIFQNFNLIPRISAIDNVMLPMNFGKAIAKQDRKPRALELLCQVGLKNRTHHAPDELSGGERQRVAIARSLANDPKIILADEPTGNLDTQTGTSIMELFRVLNQQGRTIVVVTHDKIASSYSQRTLQMSDGMMGEHER